MAFYRIADLVQVTERVEELVKTTRGGFMSIAKDFLATANMSTLDVESIEELIAHGSTIVKDIGSK